MISLFCQLGGQKGSQSYVELRNNGRIFPSWILKNFKMYKLAKVIPSDANDPCHVKIKEELHSYQKFIGKFLDPRGPYKNILLYHGLGSGKTATTINLLNIMYHYDHHSNFVILIKASLREDPWMEELQKWISREPSELESPLPSLDIFKRIHFVHYDSPYAEKDFLNVMKGLDLNIPTLFVIDEVHNFINNVYSNINSQSGKRAQVIYDYIVKEKKDNSHIRTVLISATPGINNPYELALLFNLLRANIFPKSETEFNKIFISDSTYPILNHLKKNMFQRRIMGLVSYYNYYSPGVYAQKIVEEVNLPMSPYQYRVYRFYEKIEIDIQRKLSRTRKISKIYRTYTRQSCNFVFPHINNYINGELRPRPSTFKISEKESEKFDKGKIEVETEKSDNPQRDFFLKYMESLEKFIKATVKYFEEIQNEDITKKHTLRHDLEKFKEGGQDGKSFLDFSQNGKKSKLFGALYECSPKMLAIVFLTYVSPGKVMVYTNYVLAEGIGMLKIYFSLAGFHDYREADPFYGFCEYHGRIEKSQRKNVKTMFNGEDNVYGEKCKVILLSPSATEGIQLTNIRQEHILEPYWTEVRIEQVIGRGIRQCRHKDLPIAERIVHVYRYKVTKPEVLEEDDRNRLTADQYIEDQAQAKNNLINSFRDAMKEVAIDCELFREHNMTQKSYPCFSFPEDVLKVKNIGPAYREDLKEDSKYDSGLNASGMEVVRIKVIKIQAVYRLGENSFSPKDFYWYYPQNFSIYDLTTHYLIGQVEVVDGIPNKIDKDTYIISDLIVIPRLDLEP